MKRNLTVTIALLGAVLAAPVVAFADDNTTAVQTNPTKAARAEQRRASNQFANTPAGIQQKLINESNGAGGTGGL